MPETTESRYASRKTLGAFYTPTWVADRMAQMVRNPGRVRSILEPSGGDGVFVKALLGLGMPAEKITVWDVNPETRTGLEEQKNLGVNIFIGDSLQNDSEEKFDLIIGNPPYLNKASDYIKQNRKALQKRYKDIGVNDTYAMFTRMALDRLNPGGQLIFLISDTFLTLGIHQKLRRYLLEHTRIDSITFLPEDTFQDAAVHTAILEVTLVKALENHQVRFTTWQEDGKAGKEETTLINQEYFKTTPGFVFSHTEKNTQSLQLLAGRGKLLDLLDGGLGMYTKDNTNRLRRHTGGKVTRNYRPYHKKGGAARWFAPLDHEVDWETGAVETYGMPKSAKAGTGKDDQARRGFIVSGVSSRLAARSMVKGAMWESNKCFGFFPKNPDQYPVDFFIAVLNSETYTEIAKALNHTVSMQIRDLKQLPMFDYTEEEIAELANLGRQSQAWVRDGGTEPTPFQTRIDNIVEMASNRDGIPAE